MAAKISLKGLTSDKPTAQDERLKAQGFTPGEALLYKAYNREVASHGWSDLDKEQREEYDQLRVKAGLPSSHSARRDTHMKHFGVEMSEEEAKSGSTATAEKPKDPFNRTPDPANGMPDCLCGCGGSVGSVKSGFLPGHDAKLHSLFNKLWSGEDVTIPAIAVPSTEYFEERWHKDQVIAKHVAEVAEAEIKAKTEAKAKKDKPAKAETPAEEPEGEDLGGEQSATGDLN